MLALRRREGIGARRMPHEVAPLIMLPLDTGPLAPCLPEIKGAAPRHPLPSF